MPLLTWETETIKKTAVPEKKERVYPDNVNVFLQPRFSFLRDNTHQFLFKDL